MTNEVNPRTTRKADLGHNDSNLLMARLMKSLAQKRDTGTLTHADIEAANGELAGRAFRFESDGRGGFLVVLTGMLPDGHGLRRSTRRL